jgi:hypothetical protein
MLTCAFLAVYQNHFLPVAGEKKTHVQENGQS